MQGLVKIKNKLKRLKKIFDFINIAKFLVKSLKESYKRSSPNELTQLYKINTVAYKMFSTPYLATRILKKLTVDESQNYPKAKNTVKRFLC